MAADLNAPTYTIAAAELHALQDALSDGRAALSAFVTVEELLQLPGSGAQVTLSGDSAGRLLHSLRVQADAHFKRCQMLAAGVR